MFNSEDNKKFIRWLLPNNKNFANIMVLGFYNIATILKQLFLQSELYRRDYFMNTLWQNTIVMQ